MLPCPPPPFTSCLSTSSNQANERRRRRFDEMSAASELLMAYLRRVVRHSDDNDNRRTLWRQKNVCAMCCRLLRGWCWHIQSYSSLMALDLVNDPDILRALLWREFTSAFTMLFVDYRVEIESTQRLCRHFLTSWHSIVRHSHLRFISVDHNRSRHASWRLPTSQQSAVVDDSRRAVCCFPVAAVIQVPSYHLQLFRHSCYPS